MSEAPFEMSSQVTRLQLSNLPGTAVQRTLVAQIAAEFRIIDQFGTYDGSCYCWWDTNQHEIKLQLLKT